MNEFEDCTGREVSVGDEVGVAFSYSRASVGWIKVGHVKSLEPRFHVEWGDGKISPPMKYDSNRIVRL